MAIIVMIEDKYGVKISDTEFRRLNTFQDIIDFVRENKNS
jgi:acyl carrier protein